MCDRNSGIFSLYGMNCDYEMIRRQKLHFLAILGRFAFDFEFERQQFLSLL